MNALTNSLEPRPHSPSQQHPRLKLRGTFTALIIVVTLISISSQITALPLTRIIELRYCQQYYLQHDPSVFNRDGEIPEALCKINEVQKKLGWMVGVYRTIASTVDIAGTLPMGYVADRIGARTALSLNGLATGCILLWMIAVGYFHDIFPVEAILAGPVLAFWGGGSCVLTSTTLTIIKELADGNAQRTTYLAYVTAINYMARFFSPALAGALMERNLWLPLWIGVGGTTASLFFTRLLPRLENQRADHKPEFRERSDEDDEAQSPLLQHEDPQADRLAKAYPVVNPIVALYNSYRDLLTSSNHAFRRLLCILFLTGFASSTSSLMIQYIAERYSWSYSKVGYLFTCKAAVNLLLLSVGVPTFTRLMLRRSGSSGTARVDLIGARAALVASIVGAFSIGASFNIPMLIVAICIYAVGSSFPVFSTSLALSDAVGAATSEHGSGAASLVTLVNSVGNLAGTPIMTFLWVTGIGIGGTGLGLPYFVSSAVYTLAGVVVMTVRLV